MLKKLNKKKMWLFAGTLIILVFFIGTKDRIMPQQTLIEGEWDLAVSQDLQKYLIEEEDFDYSNPMILNIAKEIKSTTKTPYDAIKKTAKYVYNNIRYNSKVSIDYCYGETASSALEAGFGDCVSMTRAVVAILRAQGIPARSMGGCLTSKRCSALFAVEPGIQAQVTPMMEGDFKKRGFLHEWVEVYDGERWLIVEATSGQIFPINCNAYLIFGYDTNKYDRCVLTDSSFWNQCIGS